MLPTPPRKKVYKMSDNLTKISPKQRKAIQELLSSGSLTAAAKNAGVSRETLYRWARQAAFKAALTEAESEALDTLARGLLALSEGALETLRGSMAGADIPAGVKLRAADIALARLLQVRELVTLEERVSRLEELNNVTDTPN